MPGVALIAHFDGNPDALAPSFRRAAEAYASTAEATQPTLAVLLRNKDGIAVVLAWPEGVSLQPFRTFVQGAIDEFELPHPRVEHLRADALTWEMLIQRQDTP